MGSVLAAEELLAKQDEYIEKAKEQATASEQPAMNRYGSGLEDFTTGLEVQRRSFDAESQLPASTDIHRQILDTRVELHLALGGGFREHAI